MQYNLARLGETVRRLRAAAGLTQAQLSERSKIDVRYIGRIEAGEIHKPGLGTILRLAEQLAGDSVDAFLSATVDGKTERDEVAAQLRTQADLSYVNRKTMRRAANMLDGGIA